MPSKAPNTLPHATIITQSQSVQLGDFVCAIGVFDGFHLGHQQIVSNTIKQAKKLGVQSVVITFDPDPDELFFDGKSLQTQEQAQAQSQEPASPLSDKSPQKLSTNKDRIRILASSGVDTVLVLPFNAQLATLLPKAFLDEVVASKGQPRGINVGANFHFGCKAAGGIKELELWGKSNGCTICAHELCMCNDCPVSSTAIRKAIDLGKVLEASALLSRPYYLEARVVRGRGMGRAMGFPTANLAIDAALLKPADGVYFGVVAFGGELYKAAISVGVPSTFANAPATIEAHILGFDADIYDHDVQVFFCERLRAMQAFSSADELRFAVEKNIEQVRLAKIPTQLEEFFNKLHQQTRETD